MNRRRNSRMNSQEGFLIGLQQEKILNEFHEEPQKFCKKTQLEFLEKLQQDFLKECRLEFMEEFQQGFPKKQKKATLVLEKSYKK